MKTICSEWATGGALATMLLATGLASAGIGQERSAPALGIQKAPCAQIPELPPSFRTAVAVREQAVRDGRPMPPFEPDALDAYRQWVAVQRTLDWAQLCRYDAENRELPPAGGRRVVLLGDSITEGWKTADPSLFEGDVLDRGISGQTTSQMLVRLRRDVLELEPKVLHLMAGTNDIAGNTGPTSLAIVQGNIMSLVEQARSHGITVVLAAIPPAARFPWRPEVEPLPAIAEMNTWLRNYATRLGLVYVDYHSALAEPSGGMRPELSEDGVHPNQAGYAIMRGLLEPALSKALAR